MVSGPELRKQEPAVASSQTVQGGNSDVPWELAGRCGALAGIGWAIFEILSELLFGPHVQLVRSLAIGSGLGVTAGLLVSVLQWWVLRGRVRRGGTLIPATTAVWTLSGLMGGLLLYYLSHNLQLYRWSLPLEGVLAVTLAGVAVACAQWAVLRGVGCGQHSTSRHASALIVGAARDLGIAIAGSVLAAVSACATSIIVTGVIGSVTERRIWPYVLLASYLAAAIVGGAIYGHVIARGLRRGFPSAPRLRHRVTIRIRRGGNRTTQISKA